MTASVARFIESFIPENYNLFLDINRSSYEFLFVYRIYLVTFNRLCLIYTNTSTYFFCGQCFIVVYYKNCIDYQKMPAFIVHIIYH